ncbi:hypothetical protein L209DRAFT_535339 [Thermothelomyces heterothallicus CBS 203.75]
MLMCFSLAQVRLVRIYQGRISHQLRRPVLGCSGGSQSGRPSYGRAGLSLCTYLLWSFISATQRHGEELAGKNPSNLKIPGTCPV